MYDTHANYTYSLFVIERHNLKEPLVNYLQDIFFLLNLK